LGPGHNKLFNYDSTGSSFSGEYMVISMMDSIKRTIVKTVRIKADECVKVVVSNVSEDNSPKQKTEFQNIVYIRKAETI
jgi:hypothetical protein